MLSGKLEYIERQNIQGKVPEAVIIWLHGLGADNADFIPLIPELNLAQSVKFVFPNAPMRPITINNGYIMRGWYDILDLGGLHSQIDRAGILDAVEQINALIDLQLKAGFSADKIFLAGFSQGGVISYTTGIMSPHQLGGVLALSCYLPDREDLVTRYTLNKSTPIFAAHGTQDNMVPYPAGIHAYQTLKSNGYNISWYEYPMGHNVCALEIQDMSQWLNRIFSQ